MDNPSGKQSLTHRLRIRLIRRADNIRQNMIILMSGLGIFLLGFLLLVTAQFLLQQSLHRELIALIGLITAIGGAITAAFGYISLSILRIFRFLLTDTRPQDD
ncbi:hypothetical protein [Amphritea balenae]|uniref:Uncharacterized protein n=1 Tax=Amphritea balenae TaxID=452629 RepID=A0A3P1SRK7_9GAMM|nr:hypothetical protein [Amphritea balenae]RRC99679.1 hypothetical protein EHS89_09315 [Amphritea balenae]GGK78922.1 hypothetical protein GCM10007941_31460 [Amphritea balenae]